MSGTRCCGAMAGSCFCEDPSRPVPPRRVPQTRALAQPVPIDPTVLPDESDVWSTNEGLGFKQRWLPGAFGERTTLHGVFRFVVHEQTWEVVDGVPTRTIIKAEVIDGTLVEF